MCNSITLGGCGGAYLRSYFAQGDCFALGGCSSSIFGCGFGGCGMNSMMMSAGIGLGYGLGSLLGNFMPAIGKGLAAAGSGIWSGLKWAGNGIWSGIKWLGNGIWSGLKWVGKGIWSGLKGAWNGIKSIFKKD